MDFIFIMFLLFLIVMITHSDSKPSTEPTERKCPPHQWYSAEVKDKEGNFLYHQLRCKICGPLSNRSNENRGY